jgi:hypothetical protein
MAAIGAYLLGAAFWIFLGSMAIAGMVYDYKRRRVNVDLLRFAIEKGQTLDPASIEKLTAQPPSEPLDPVLVRLGGIITVATGIGVCLLSFFIGRVAPVAFYPILGGGVVVVCVGVGLIVGARALEQARARGQLRNTPQ